VSRIDGLGSGPAAMQLGFAMCPSSGAGASLAARPQPWHKEPLVPRWTKAW
jgi:hypothetical protein